MIDHSYKLKGKYVVIQEIFNKNNKIGGWYYINENDTYRLFNLSHNNGYSAFYKVLWRVIKISDSIILRKDW